MNYIQTLLLKFCAYMATKLEQWYAKAEGIGEMSEEEFKKFIQELK